MPEWKVEYLEHDFSHVETFDPLNPVVVLNHKEPSTFTCEIALSDPNLTRELIGPKRNDFRIWRDGLAILDGELRKVSLANERDTLLCEHSDYMQYLDDRIYPFHYPFTFGDWPKKWTAQDIVKIAEDIIEAAMDDDAYGLPIVFGNSLAGKTTNYKIDAGDSTKVLEHVRQLADMDPGFDFQLRRDGSNVRFTTFAPQKDDEEIIYNITDEVGQITQFDWANNGPDGTFTLGLGSGSQNKSRAAEFTHTPSREQFRRRDWVVDFGNVRNLDHLERLTAAENHKVLFPQKELELGVLVDTAELPNFWAESLGRPYSLLGRRIWVGPILFQNYWLVDAAFKILDMTIEPDEDGNEFVTFGLDMIDG